MRQTKLAMQRRHYELIARIVREELETVNSQLAKAAIKNIALSFADELASDNPNFDRSRFFEACGLDNERSPS